MEQQIKQSQQITEIKRKKKPKPKKKNPDTYIHIQSSKILTIYCLMFPEKRMNVYA